MARLERHHASDPVNALDLAQVQDNIEATLQPLLMNPILDGGILLSRVALGATTVAVPHKLNRALRGWVVVDRDADARVWRDASTVNPTPTSTLPLKASAAVNVTLYVF